MERSQATAATTPTVIFAKGDQNMYGYIWMFNICIELGAVHKSHNFLGEGVSAKKGHKNFQT